MVTLALAAIGVSGLLVPSTQTATPPTEQETVTPNKTPSSDKTDKPDSMGVVDTDVENQRRFDALRNELRRELLDDRADTINWWLTATAIFLTFLGIVVVLGGYIGFQRFEKIEADAKKNAEQSKKSADEAQELVKTIKEQRKQAEEATQQIQKMHGAYVEGPKVETVLQQVQANPEASSLDKAIDDALTLQQEGNIEEAIEKWRSIANIAEGSDNNDIAARAWFSIGYLIQEGDEDAEEQ